MGIILSWDKISPFWAKKKAASPLRHWCCSSCCVCQSEEKTSSSPQPFLKLALIDASSFAKKLLSCEALNRAIIVKLIFLLFLDLHWLDDPLAGGVDQLGKAWGMENSNMTPPSSSYHHRLIFVSSSFCSFLKIKITFQVFSQTSFKINNHK